MRLVSAVLLVFASLSSVAATILSDRSDLHPQHGRGRVRRGLFARPDNRDRSAGLRWEFATRCEARLLCRGPSGRTASVFRGWWIVRLGLSHRSRREGDRDARRSIRAGIRESTRGGPGRRSMMPPPNTRLELAPPVVVELQL